MGFVILACVLLADVVVLLPYEVKSDFLAWPPRRKISVPQCVKLAFHIYIMPGVAEEVLFRVLPLPLLADRKQTLFYYWMQLVFVGLVFSVPYHLDTMHHR